MEEWTSLYITNPSDREAVAIALFRAGYSVRRKKVKEVKQTVIILEYKKD